MYLEYWGLKKPPFNNVPDPDFFYMSDLHKEGLTRLIYAANMRKGCALLTGDIGCGKTTLCKVFIQTMLDERFDVALISNPCLEPTEFLQDVLYRFQIAVVPDSRFEILRVLNNKLNKNLKEDKDTLLIIDEAQFLNEATLEEISLLLNFQLSNRFLLTILLLGRPKVIDKIKRVKQLEQRIAVSYHLSPFSLKETANYIFFRQKKAGANKNVFSKEAILLVYKYSKGSPRAINNLCDLALLIGFGKKEKTINLHVIRDIIKDGAV
jgi:general secretion pathway protein A